MSDKSKARRTAQRKAASTVLLLVAVSLAVASRGAAAIGPHGQHHKPCNAYTCPPGERPVAPNQKFVVPVGQQTDELLGAYDPEGTITKWILKGENFNAHQNGFVWKGDGTFLITPRHKGILNLEYQVRDNNGLYSRVATVTLLAENQPPPPPTTTTTTTTPPPPPSGFDALCTATKAAFGRIAGGALCGLIGAAASAASHGQRALEELDLHAYEALVRVSALLHLISSQQASSLIGMAQSL